MGVVDEAVENSVGDRWIADNFVPTIDRERFERTTGVRRGF